MAILQIVKPSQDDNLAINPIFGGTTGYAAYGGATLTRTLASASTPTRWGWYSLRVQTAGTNRGATLTVKAMANAQHTFAIWVRGTFTQLQARAGAGAFANMMQAETDGDATRWYIQPSAGDCNAATTFDVIDTTTGADFYILGWMCIQATYLRTQFDGGMGDGFRWLGPAHGSASRCYAIIPGSNTPNTGHGRLYDLDSSTFLVTSMSGFGLPSVNNLALALYTEAAKDAAKQRLWAKGMSFLTGVPGYNYSPEERQLTEANAQIKQLGYGPDNPYGSKTAMDTARDQNPNLGPFNTKSALVPSTDAKYQPMAPAQSAQNTSKEAERADIEKQMHAAVEAYTTKNPNAEYKDVAAVQAPFKAQIDALDQKYPDAGYPEGNGGPPKGMNPQERAQWQLDQLLYGSKEGSPQPPAKGKNAEEWLKNGATPEQIQEYYKAKAEFVKQQLDKIDASAGGVFAEQGEPAQDWQPIFKQLTKGKYSDDLLRELAEKDMGPNEKRWNEMNDFRSELTAAKAQRLSMPMESVWITPSMVYRV
jgi:hypothetical protein